MKRNPEDRLTDSELEQFAAGAGSPAMQSAARELLALRDATRNEVKGCPKCGQDFPKGLRGFLVGVDTTHGVAFVPASAFDSIIPLSNSLDLDKDMS